MKIEHKINKYHNWGKETITDYFLASLVNVSHHIKNRSFTKYAETGMAQTGAAAVNRFRFTHILRKAEIDKCNVDSPDVFL